MLYALLLSIMIIDGFVLGVVILLQSGKGGGLAAVGGGAGATDGILGGRQATTLLTRTTWITGTIFLVLALGLSIMSSRQSGQVESLTRTQLQGQAGVPTPAFGGGAASDGSVPLPGAGGEVPPPTTGGDPGAGGTTPPPDSGDAGGGTGD